MFAPKVVKPQTKAAVSSTGNLASRRSMSVEHRVEAAGIYRAIPMPKKGPAAADEKKSHAFLELNDGKRVYLEAFGVARATRPEEELQHFDGRRVTIVGVAHMIMPSPGAGLVAPCLSEVESVVEAE
jgi:hypothetical protein